MRGISAVLTATNENFSHDRQRIRCVIADDHALVRYGVRRLLEDDLHFSVVGEASDTNEAVKLALAERPDLLLLDIGMPGMSAFEAGRIIGEHGLNTRVVFLTMHEDEDYVARALEAGASGYLLKDTPSHRLLHALREIHRGERVLSPQLTERLKRNASASGVVSSMRRNHLTGREREVMKLLAEGHTVRKTAEVLGVSMKTVEAHKFNLMRKLDIHNKAQLVTAAIQKKIVRVPLPS